MKNTTKSTIKDIIFASSFVLFLILICTGAPLPAFIGIAQLAIVFIILTILSK